MLHYEKAQTGFQEQFLLMPNHSAAQSLPKENGYSDHSIDLLSGIANLYLLQCLHNKRSQQNRRSDQTPPNQIKVELVSQVKACIQRPKALEAKALDSVA